ncbi:MAG: HNH endonuclease [Gammaproteobacteria bacterium]|nr:HNH endonuclease [Gammaproteobacteria bacterium]MDA7989586.1 HNH endonuclease [Gammaproteobacteria bacterium]MDA8010949.1 HNH endonuclease [Gammaproteobacteria bacterium]
MVKPGTIFTGDNLPILRGMDSGSVDLIYLDPPFNSKRDYAAPIGSKAAGAEFKDTWTLADTDDAWWGEIADKNPSLYKVIDAAGAAGGKSDKAYCIYMAMRLLEMRRVLKPLGSIYYHCDPTMSHAVKLVMDAIFGGDNFRNEIIWHYASPGGRAKTHFAKKSDTILFYANSGEVAQGKGFYPDDKALRAEISQTSMDMHYRHVDSDGRRYREVRSNGKTYRYYQDEGKAVDNVWDDVGIAPSNTPLHREYQGYPTQKPLALLNRIIAASSKEGDLVLDPFCGCATACVAAQYGKRGWIGIDISPKAYDLTLARFEKELGIFNPKIIHRSDIPERADRQKRSRDIKHILFGKQRGICNGCLYDFQFRHFHVDHIVARDVGGPDSDDNLQLLCGNCNSIKGTGTMEKLIAELDRRGLRNKPRA